MEDLETRKVGRPKSPRKEWKKELEENPNKIDYIAEKSCVRESKELIDIPEGIDYTAEQRLEAVTAYFITGSMKKAAEQVGIKETIIRRWKASSPWWTKALEQVKRKKQDELDSKLTNLLEKTLDELRDRLMHGDEIVTAKGKKGRRKVSAKDLGVISGILYDKRRDIRSDDSQEQVRSNEDTLKDLKGKFEELSREINAKTIEGEAIKESQNGRIRQEKA